MKRIVALSKHRSARRLVGALVVSSVLTIASFLTSTAISENRARGIDHEANLIGEYAVPASELLSNARADLRHLEEELDNVVYRGAPLDALDDERADLTASWTKYTAIPEYPGEKEVWRTASVRITEMDASIARVLEHVREQDHQRAVDELTTRTRPIMGDVADALRNAGAINLRAAGHAASEIARLRESSNALHLALTAASALSAAVAAFLVIRMARRYVMLTDERLEEMSLFADRLAHDIRSPLSAVGLALDLAKTGPDVEPKTRSILERGTNTLQRVGQLIDGLLVFARAGKPEPGDSGANLRDVLTGVVEDLRRGAEEKNITLEAEPPLASTGVACSPGVLVSVISNLVGNAIKHLGDAPVRQVSVRVREQRRMVRIEVRDTGPGVASDLRERIFDPYARAENGPVPGLGLGLATVRRLAEAHDGTVGVEPNVGGGSIFWVQLPKVNVAASARGAPRLSRDAKTT
jgi:signal transduction histidine kinase